MVFFQELVHARDSRGAIHIVITKDKDFFACGKGLQDAVNGSLHVFHEKGIVQVGKLGAKEFFGFLERLYTPLDKD